MFQLGWNFDGPHLAVRLRLSRRGPDKTCLADTRLSGVAHRVSALSLHLCAHGLLGLIGGLIGLAIAFLKPKTFVIRNAYPPEGNKNTATCKKKKSITTTATAVGTAENEGAKEASLRLGFSSLGLPGQLEELICFSHAPAEL